MCKVEMFGAWLRMDTGATYRKLAKVLVTLGKRNIAEALCTARGMEFTVLECVYYIYGGLRFSYIYYYYCVAYIVLYDAVI